MKNKNKNKNKKPKSNSVINMIRKTNHIFRMAEDCILLLFCEDCYDEHEDKMRERYINPLIAKNSEEYELLERLWLQSDREVMKVYKDFIDEKYDYQEILKPLDKDELACNDSVGVT